MPRHRLLFATLVLASPLAAAQPFALAEQGRLPAIVHDGQATMRLAAGLLARDLQALSGLQAATSTRFADCEARCIVVGTAGSPLVRDAARKAGIDLGALRGQRERYLRAASGTMLLIAGADPRGAAYGVVDLSRELGVSPWEWWADVAPRRPAQLAADGAHRLSPAPSVEYRGIFINDEDWGLQPWAARTYDKAGDIGPATYARVFELLWRLKANIIWPAMHPSTKAFFAVPGNAQMAADYAIVVGSSHAEPMLRNNVGEWNGKTDGPFNYFSNRDALLRYWQSRVDESTAFDAVYTMGLRGAHDSAMEGVRDAAHGRDTLAEVIGVQRAMLARARNKPAHQVPQVLTLYKEVLDFYNTGLQVPDDVTLVWPDDNYGYLHQLSTEAERKRSGGAGIYYHLSYWGRPHDYLWLATTHPALVRDQLQRAWATGARKAWVVNVGDIKPAEYLTQYFLDMAFDASALRQDPRQHLQAWAAAQFGPALAQQAAAIMLDYYELAWERRPEFMGFGETEPTRPNRASDYIRTGGEEAEQRLARYRALAAQAEALSLRVPAPLRDAWFQLVLYPVRAAANLNTRILRLELAAEYARQRRPSADWQVQQARQAHAALVADTAAYNALGKGKWKHIMDMAPRRLPVFDEPVYPSYGAGARRGCGVVLPALQSVEGDRIVLRQGQPSARTLTLASHGGAAAAWSVRTSAGVRADIGKGELSAANGYEQRIAIAYDGSAGPALSLQCGAQVVKVNLRADSPAAAGMPGERERIVVLAAGSAPAHPDWEAMPGLGSSGLGLRSRLDLPARGNAGPAAAQPLAYRFASPAGAAQLRLVAVPVHPLTSAHRLRIAVSLDDGPPAVFDYTTAGRSDEWKQNVLGNSAVRTIDGLQLKAGLHTLRVVPLDPGFVLDRIDVVFDGAPRYYGKPPADPAPAVQR